MRSLFESLLRFGLLAGAAMPRAGIANPI